MYQMYTILLLYCNTHVLHCALKVVLQNTYVVLQHSMFHTRCFVVLHNFGKWKLKATHQYELVLARPNLHTRIN